MSIYVSVLGHMEDNNCSINSISIILGNNSLPQFYTCIMRYTSYTHTINGRGNNHLLLHLYQRIIYIHRHDEPGSWNSKNNLPKTIKIDHVLEG